MDTGTHVIMGVSLGGLALSVSDPGIANHTEALCGFWAAAIAGSNAPDFDILLRVRGHAHYLLHHRGFSHSLPMLAVWPLLLALVIALLFRDWPCFMPILFWALAGVVLHVGLDLFNAYGVQSFRPFSRKWVHLDIMPIFDPLLFGLHAAGLVLWLFRALPAQAVFLAVYLLTFGLIGIRWLMHKQMLRLVRQRYGPEGYSFVVPCWLPHQWNFVHETVSAFATGSLAGFELREEAVFERESTARIGTSFMP